MCCHLPMRKARLRKLVEFGKGVSGSPPSLCGVDSSLSPSQQQERSSISVGGGGYTAGDTGVKEKVLTEKAEARE